VPDNPRIEELRRRIQRDPASIAFAQLAEEHRRAGEFDEAVRVCRAGLAQHPAYLSARITLGRALLEMGRYDEAAAEFDYVLKAAPDNLTAVRELADIEQRKRAASVQSPVAVAVGRAPAIDHQPPTTDHHPPTTNHQPLSTSHQPPTTNHQPVLAELEAWLAVIAEERGTRSARI
jgi:tetratricopeptide (TPR) repeat protein